MIKIRKNGENHYPPLNEVVWLYNAITEEVYLGARMPIRAVSHNRETTFFWGVQTSYAYAQGAKVECDLEIRDFNPTHWAPVPTLPVSKPFTQKAVLAELKTIAQPAFNWDKYDRSMARYSFEDLEDFSMQLVEALFAAKLRGKRVVESESEELIPEMITGKKP